MANVSGASLNGIYNRLHDAPEYHPLSANTFADWSLEAGDIVTVTRDGKSYASPTMNSTTVWRKKQQVTLNATGNEQRDTVAKMSQRKFRGGGASLRATQKAFDQIVTSYNEMTAGLVLASSTAHLYVDNMYTQMKSGLYLTASTAHLYVDNKYTQMTAGLNLTSSSARLYVDNKYSQMSAGLSLTSSTAKLYVDNKYSQMTAGLNLTSSTAKLYVDNKYAQMTAGLNLTSSTAKLYVDNKYAQMSAGLSLTSSTALLAVNNAYAQMKAGLFLSSSTAHLYVDNKYAQMTAGLVMTSSVAKLYVDNKYSQMTAGLALTSSTAKLYVDNKYSQMTAGLNLTSSTAKLYVDNKYSQMTAGLTLSESSARLYARSAENAAEIAARINESTGQSEIQLDAQKVYIGNQKSTTVISGKLNASDVTADYIKGKIASISSVSMQSLVASDIQFSVGGGLYGNPANAIMNLQLYQDGNSYQIWGAKFNGEIVKTSSFSRAVTSWTWAGSDGQVKVTAQPQNQTLGVDVRVKGDSTISSNGTYTYKVQYEDNNGSWWDTGASQSVTVSVSVSPTAEISDNGSSEPSGISGLGDLGTVTPAYNPNWCIVTAKAGSSSKPYKLKIDGSTIYSSGKTQGMYNFYHNSNWSGHWTGDGTHGSTSGKHYVTGPNVDCSDWECYYCIEDEAASAGIQLEAHTHNGYLNRAQCGVDQDEMPIYLGKLYMKVGSSYVAITANDYYWFYSSSSFGGSRTVYY